MAQVTVSNVRMAWVNYCNMAEAAGFVTDAWHMQEGSSTRGVQYSGRTGDGSAVPGAIGMGFNSAYLGSTRRETYDALLHITATMQAVVELHNAV